MSQRVQTLYTVTFHWRDGKTDTAEGWGTSKMSAAADAMNHMGYGNGALAALDYWDAEEAAVSK